MLKTSQNPKYVILALLGGFVPFFVILWMTFVQTGGYYEYPLDDPYIHLAMSEQIAKGGYGVNAGEYASAASSILFPFLLAPFASLSWHWLTPLLWGVFGLAASCFVWGRVTGHLALRAPDITKTYLALLALLGPLFLHLVGVSLQGMEHGLQVMAAMMVAYGLIRFAQDGEIRWFLVAGILLSPALRFEGLAVACFACAVLLFSNRSKGAIAIGIGALIPVIAYGIAMTGLDLAPLPNSVLAKSAVVGGDTHFVSGEEDTVLLTMISTLKISFESASGRNLAALSVLWVMGAWIWRRRFSRTEILLALSISAISGAHFLLGSVGFFFRYEIYAWSYGAVVSLYLLSKLWDNSETAARFAPVVFLLVVSVSGHHYLLQSFYTFPHASAAIGVQQKQMGRFVDDYVKGPVAVNDLGHVAYRNPHYVLDFWGLASREALDARRDGRNPNWADDLIERYNVGVIMIYDSWFVGRMNPDWIKIGEMSITRPLGALGGSAVSFHAVSESDVAKLTRDLENFAPTLPDGTKFKFVN